MITIEGGKTMRRMESFLMLYFLLDQCYRIDRGDDGDNTMVLGSFLGDIDPTIWDNGRPIDQATYHKWITNNDISALNHDNIIDAVIRFLHFYENRGFYFAQTEAILQGQLQNQMIEIASERTKWMYKEYNYPDQDLLMDLSYNGSPAKTTP